MERVDLLWTNMIPRLPLKVPNFENSADQSFATLPLKVTLWKDEQDYT